MGPADFPTPGPPIPITMPTLSNHSNWYVFDRFSSARLMNGSFLRCYHCSLGRGGSGSIRMFSLHFSPRAPLFI